MTNKVNNITIIINYFYFLLALFLSVLVSFKAFGLDLDYNNYFNSFEFSYDNKEPFIRFIEVGIKWLNLDFNAFLFLITLISLSLKFYFFRKYSSLPILTVLCYLITFFWLHEYTQIRASLAIGFSLIFVAKTIEGKYKQSFIFLIFSVLSHYSAIINIFIYSIIKLKNTYLIILFLIATSLIFLIDINSFENILKINSNILKLYTENHGPKEIFKVFNLNIISIIFTLLACFLFDRKFNLPNQKYIIILFFSLLIYFFFAKLELMTISFRLLEFYLPMILVLLTNKICIHKNKSVWIIILILFTSTQSYNLLTNVVQLK
tara:strand:- start:20732 stop:21691 length:960 start_codon:yes stop_codon:yes gene_type:complete